MRKKQQQSWKPPSGLQSEDSGQIDTRLRQNERDPKNMKSAAQISQNAVDEVYSWYKERGGGGILG